MIVNIAEYVVQYEKTLNASGLTSVKLRRAAQIVLGRDH